MSEDNTVSFEDIADLNISTDETKPPEPLPNGQYVCRLAKPKARQVEVDEKDENFVNTGQKVKKTIVEVLARPFEIYAGVDADELDEKDIKLTERAVKLTYWIEQRSLHKLNSLYEACGLDFEGKPHNEILPELEGAVLIVTTKIDGKGYAQANGFEKAEG